MGILIEGVWNDQWYDTQSTGGRFVRSESRYRNWITPDGNPGPTGDGGFTAEPGRYLCMFPLPVHGRTAR
jgi:putative glutathione S-transferase